MNEYQIEALVSSIVKRVQPNNTPFERVLWDLERVGSHLNLTPNYVRENYCCRPDFPKPIRIDKKGKLLYKAKEICDWVEGFRQ